MTALFCSSSCSHEFKSGDAMAMPMSMSSNVNGNGNGNVGDCSTIPEGKDTGAFVVARCREILAYYEDEYRKSDHQMARWLVEQLTREEQEVAARCSYAYWFLSQRASKPATTSATTITESVRLSTAMREAIRHTDCADNAKDVLKIFRTTLEFHARNKTTLYRTCMLRTTAATTTTISEPTETNATRGTETTAVSTSSIATVSSNENEQQLSQERRERIHDEMNNYQTNVVRGHDRENRAIFFAFPRKTAGTSDSEQAFVDSLTYTMERAVAASEFRSIGRQDQIVCVLDTKGSSCPPFKTCQAALGILQHFYPGRLKTCVILNSPYLVTALFKMMKPFMHPITVSKFLLTKAKRNNNNKEEDSVLSRLIDDSQAMPEMMPGRGKLTSKVNVDRYLYSVPFYRLYDTGSGSCSSYRATNQTETETDPKVGPTIIKPRQKRLGTDSTLSTADFISVSTSSLSSESIEERIVAKKKGIGFVRKGITKRFRKKGAGAAAAGSERSNADADDNANGGTSSGGTDAGRQKRRRFGQKGSVDGGSGERANANANADGTSSDGADAGKQKRRRFGKKGSGRAGGGGRSNADANGTNSAGTDVGKQKRRTRKQPGVSVRSLAVGRLMIRCDPKPGVVDFKINPRIVAAIG